MKSSGGPEVRGRVSVHRPPRKAKVREKPDLTPDSSLCPLCGAVYSHKVWRSKDLARRLPLTGVNRAMCPACRQVIRGEGSGRVLIRGVIEGGRREELRRRILNVVSRAGHTQPEKRLTSMVQTGDELEVITTSQGLAHRIARELEKAFGAHATYAWSDRDGTLEAICDISG